MYAIFTHGGKQYQVRAGQTVRLEKINLQIGSIITISSILMIIDDKDVKIGYPKLLNSNIYGQIVQHGKYKKVHIIKFKRRKHYKKTQGHRQCFTDIKINQINF